MTLSNHKFLPACAALAAVATLSAAFAGAPGMPGSDWPQPTFGGPPQAPPIDISNGYPNSDPTEQIFVSEAADFIHLEHQLATLALQKSSDLKVQTYARRVLATTQRMSDELARIAHDQADVMPADTSAHNAEVHDLTTLQGLAFDRAYIQASMTNHQAAIAEFQNEDLSAQLRSERRLGSWALRNVALLNDELGAARSLAQAIGDPSW